jgi:DNA-binding beta-propeller fold protein YncE
MEDIGAVLKAAGWSDDIIKAFLDPSITVVNPVPMSVYITNTFSNEVDEINLSKKMDSTSLVISCPQGTK